MGEFIITSYDLYCPTVEPHLSKRCCSLCGIYHASTNSATNHKECLHKPAQPTVSTPMNKGIKRRPVRIAAGRQREMMVILRDHLNEETAERFGVDEIHFDHDNYDEREPPARDDVVLLAGSIQEWTSTAWEDV